MRQTTKYKFNIIETSDTFGPEKLNENAETAERELARVEAELSAGDAAVKAGLETALAEQRSQLEANHTALAQTVAAVEKGALLYKLGEASADKANQTMAITDVNAADFAVLLLFVCVQEQDFTVTLTANSTTLGTASSGGTPNSNSSVALTAWMVPALNGTAYNYFYTCRYQQTDGVTNYTTERRGGVALLNWSAITKVQISGNYKAGANFVLYGIKK